MRHLPVLTAVAMLTMSSIAQGQPPAPQTYTLSGNGVRAYNSIQRDLLDAASKMPEAEYGFKPTPETRPFGQLVAHVALSQLGACAIFKSDERAPHNDEKEEAPRTKAQLVALLKESASYCDPVLTTLKDEDLTALTKSGRDQRAKGLFLMGVVVHGNEVYGSMAVYLRLKGIVPPSTERQTSAKPGQ